MLELKTLKDLNEECKYMDDCCRHCLRKEAINWVKNCSSCPTASYCPACMRFKKFFNLTEKDLDGEDEYEVGGLPMKCNKCGFKLIQYFKKRNRIFSRCPECNNEEKGIE